MPEIQSVPRIRKDLEHLARDWDIPETELKQVTLVIEELFSSIIRHTHRKLEGTPVSLRFSKDGPELDILISDEGFRFNPLEIDKAHPADPVATDEGTMGLALIQAFSDSIEYQREGECNRLHIRKTIRSNQEV